MEWLRFPRNLAHFGFSILLSVTDSTSGRTTHAEVRKGTEHLGQSLAKAVFFFFNCVFPPDGPRKGRSGGAGRELWKSGGCF